VSIEIPDGSEYTEKEYEEGCGGVWQEVVPGDVVMTVSLVPLLSI
jgi:hypothetical protein